jgi:hypothetical protein
MLFGLPVQCGHEINPSLGPGRWVAGSGAVADGPLTTFSGGPCAIGHLPAAAGGTEGRAGASEGRG